jgi:hypothetical protein
VFTSPRKHGVGMVATGVLQSRVVGLPASVDVDEDEGIVVNRTTMASPGTADDLFQFQYEGNRTGYANEYGNLRSRGAPDQVAFRCQCHSSDNDTSQVILDVTLADNTSLFSVDALGDARLPSGDFILGGQTLSAAGAWTAPTYGTGIAGSVGDPYYPVGARLEAWGRVFLRGRVITSAGVSYVGDATILTLPANHRPAKTLLYTIRTQGTGAANGTISIDTSGNLSFSAGISLTGGQTASWQLDGVNFPVAV